MIELKTHDPPQKRWGMDEKTWVAFTSVIVAIILTGTKLVVGIWSHSLGILSEALHSALDFVAAAMTYFAVTSSAKPADPDHQFGHGKIENLSALVETILLLITIVWVVYEAARRIILSQLEINTNPIVFAVVLFAIIIDYSRSRALYRVAKKFDSQALKADALHFSTDIWSSSVVFVGLFFTRLGFPLGDPLGAIGVTIIVLIMTIKLGREAVDTLLDRAPLGFRESICAAVEEVEGVMSCGRVRVRKSGPSVFVDAEIRADLRLPLEKAHQIGEQAKFTIEKVVGPADITIHMDPEAEIYPLLVEKIRTESDQFEWIKSVHEIFVFEFENQVYVVFHIEINAEESLGDAHMLVMSFENHLKHVFPNIKNIITHIEPFRDTKKDQIDLELVKQRIHLRAQRVGGLQNCHDITIYPLAAGDYHITLHCDAEPSLTIREIHRATTRLENEIQEEMPIFSQIVIHVEPFFDKNSDYFR